MTILAKLNYFLFLTCGTAGDANLHSGSWIAIVWESHILHEITKAVEEKERGRACYLHPTASRPSASVQTAVSPRAAAKHHWLVNKRASCFIGERKWPESPPLSPPIASSPFTAAAETQFDFNMIILPTKKSVCYLWSSQKNSEGFSFQLNMAG